MAQCEEPRVWCWFRQIAQWEKKSKTYLVLMLRIVFEVDQEPSTDIIENEKSL